MSLAALVTGGSRGIGFALARTLCAEGYALTLSARGSDRLDAAAAELRALGGEVHVVAGDLSHEAGVAAAVAAHRDRYGRLDLLVNNVGTGFGQPVAAIARSRLDLQLALNLRSAILCYRESVPLLLAAGQEHGRAWAVNVCSRAAVSPQPWLSVYSATKAALLAFSVAMNRELSPRGVRSCAICPGTVATALTDSPDIDAGRLVAAEDVAAVMRLLLALSPACQLTEVVLESSFDADWRPPV
jgi:NAD(P)-dependent dehydrogenase (short-subunit alcohol dehydrogenase family)